MRKTVTALRTWLVQRVSAIYMLLFILFVLFHFLLDPPHSYLVWHDWLMSPAVSIATMAFFASLLLHAWVGIRDVLMDYVHPLALRIPALALLGISLVAIAAWVVRILLIGHS